MLAVELNLWTISSLRNLELAKGRKLTVEKLKRVDLVVWTDRDRLLNGLFLVKIEFRLAGNRTRS